MRTVRGQGGIWGMAEKGVKLDGHKVRMIRERKGMSRKELAAAADIDVRTVEKIEENDQHHAYHDVHAGIAAALSVSEASILRNNEDTAVTSVMSAQLHCSLKLLPLDTFGTCLFGKDKAEHYLHGFKFRIALQNLTGVQMLVDLMGLSMGFKTVPAGEWRRVSQAGARYGDVASPHELLLQLGPDGVSGSWTIQTEGGRQTRKIQSGNKEPFQNLLQCEDESPLLFTLLPGRMELITGAVRTTAPGQYETAFVIGYLAQGTSRQDWADPVWILHPPSSEPSS